MERTKILEKVDIFCGLSPTQLESLAQISEERRYRAGEVVFAEHSPGREMYLVKKGKVCIELGLRGKSDAATVHRVGAGQVFGELSLVDRRKRSATAVCENDCELVAIDHEKLDELFNQDNHLGYIVMKNLAELLAGRLRRTNLQLVASILWE
jgi:CRP/FNR family cyclic AMP-dependent transcriptional regulator